MTISEEKLDSIPEASPNDPPQVDQRYYIRVLEAELTELTNNRRFLLALIAQMQEEFKEAREVWSLERASLMKGRRKTEEAS